MIHIIVPEVFDLAAGCRQTFLDGKTHSIITEMATQTEKETHIYATGLESERGESGRVGRGEKVRGEGEGERFKLTRR